MFTFNLIKFSKEYRKFIKIGLPILGSQLVMYGMTTVDYIMAGWYREDFTDGAGVGLAAAIYSPIYFLTAGAMFAVAPIIAQHFGAKEFEQIKIKTRKFLWTGLFVGFIFYLILSNAGKIIFDFLEIFAKEFNFEDLFFAEDIKTISLGYLDIVAFAAIPITLFQVFRGYSEGITQTRIVFILGLLGFLINIPLNYYFIFELDMGGIGCAYATAIVSWLGLITLWLLTLFLKQYKTIRIYGNFIWPDFRSSFELLKLGIPISFGIFVELSMFSGAALVMYFFGKDAVGAHTIAINLVGLLFMLPLSLGLASAIRVGNLIGEKNYSQANYASNFSLRFSLIVAITNFILIVSMGSLLISIYTSDPNVSVIALTLLAYAAIFQVPDAIGYSAIGSLRGHKDTFGPMVNFIISYWFIAIPIGVYLSFSDSTFLPTEAEGMWTGMIIGIVVSAILNTLRLKNRKKDLKRFFKSGTNQI